MRRTLASAVAPLIIVFSWSGTALPQSSTGTIFGTVFDQHQAVIPGATVTGKNIETGFTRTTTTDSNGGYRLADIPTGNYELLFDAPTFSGRLRKGVTLDVGQSATIDETLEPGELNEQVSNENASMLDSTTAEVSTRFDSRRLSELPIASNRNVYNILGSAAGISQRASGQTAFTLGISISVNGGRIRSNNFMLDGQDINDPAIAGSQFALNNPDAIQEVRIITNQFLPEYGRNASSVVNIITRSGTNEYHGSAFWFHNNESLNACSNTDKGAGFCNPGATTEEKRSAPLRREDQIGFTLGGPVVLPRFGEGGPYFYKGKDHTFFFFDHQRWHDRRTPSLTIRGAPTEEGRRALQTHAPNRPQVEALLRFVPAGTPNGLSRSITTPDGSFTVPLGNFTNSANFKFDSDQGSIRIDHRPDDNNFVYGRYRYSFETTQEANQITPPGHGTAVAGKAHAAAFVWTSLFSSSVTNEARIAWKKYSLDRDAEDPFSYTIPAIEIEDLGMTGAQEAENRTGFGLSTALPVIRTSETYQVTEAISIFKGSHDFKFGGEIRRSSERSFLFSLPRGNLVYDNLNNFVNDRARVATKGLPLAGSDMTQFYTWHEIYLYAQDQWKVLPNLTLLYGIRYEYPGDMFDYLREANERVLAANNNNPAFRFEPYPKSDMNNWMPRVGLNWNPRTSGKGVLGFITGGDKLAVRLGYARAYDAWLVNINQTMYTSFPFTANQTLTGPSASFTNLTNLTVPNLQNPNMLTRVIVPEDFRSPAVDQISFDIQREMFTDFVLRIGYIRTRGTGLFQSVQGNPTLPCVYGSAPPTCNTTGIDPVTGADAPLRFPLRVDGNRGIVTIRGNSASSTYDALQTSFEKRLSHGLSFGLHYTWSSLIDTASDFFSPSVAEAGVPQDPYDWNADRGRGAYDRPHRLSGNFVYDLPFFSKQHGVVGKLLGGWQVNSFFNFQSGAPFTPLNGSDPAGASGAIRPNLFTDLDLSRMSVAEMFQIDRQLREQAVAQARQIFGNITFGPGRCISSSWLPGPSLPLTLFAAPRGRIVCDAQGRRSLDVVYNGILPGQRIGNAGRNILRADGFRSVDIGIIKNTQVTKDLRIQFWTDFLNAFNWRNFGIPNSVISSPTFLDQWATDGGSRRIRLGARVVF